jgi:phenylacetate-coenzyme A ligase PaaK-like adenylate-forming protein
MNFDFSAYPLRNRGYSTSPMTILDTEPQAMLCGIMELALIETGNRSGREHWQRTQLRNLIKHAIGRSAFWRSRLGGRRLSDIELASLPTLTRHDLRKQVASEGPLLQASDRLATKVHATSGSSGIPVSFYVSEFNARYNSLRSVAQHFMQGQDLSLNRTRVSQAYAPRKDGIVITRDPCWIGPLASIIKSGTNKRVQYLALGDEAACRRLVEELKKDEIGYLVCNPRLIDTLLCWVDLGFLKDARTAMWLPLGENIDRHLIDAFADLAIPIRANYSSEEVGLIAAECDKLSGYYHVATSNVMVEVVDRTHEVDGVKLGTVLVTHLHSYATPFIRYDLGDLACLRDECPCGHDGPTIYNLQGRASRVIKHQDGRLSPFYIRSKDLAALADFAEFRIRQPAFDKIVIEIGGRSELRADEIAAISGYLKERAGDKFEIEVRACSQIDWGQSRKRPGFRCEI